MSTVLTSTPLRRRGPKTNRAIPTIPTERTDAGPVDVSAVDTEPRTRSTLTGSWRRSPAPSPRGRPCSPLPGPFRLPHRGPETMVQRQLRPRQATDRCLRCPDTRNSQKP
ncbi:hypothetical protein BKH31_03890 [Actinomyces oris]|uniref:Uncharacterized protein n=1 Tax=Actinomyces oris TaxID=544580 RepID=A0A1Q8VHD5_9ACTO|nr:hypothetical protein BKH31_03890 [Actinomyces oris]